MYNHVQYEQISLLNMNKILISLLLMIIEWKIALNYRLDNCKLYGNNLSFQIMIVTITLPLGPMID